MVPKNPDSSDKGLWIFEQQAAKETKETISNYAEKISGFGFFGFATFTIILADVCRDLSDGAPKEAYALKTWGVIDAACSSIIGLTQLFSRTANPIETKSKGITNILSASQLAWLALISLGHVGFAVNATVSLSHASYDAYKNYRCLNDKEFWKETNDKEIAFLKQEIKSMEPEIKKIQEKFKSTPTNSLEHKSLKWALEKAEARKDKMELQLTERKEAKSSNDGLGDKMRKKLSDDLQKNTLDMLTYGSILVATILLPVPGVNLLGFAFITLAVGLHLYKNRNMLSGSFIFNKQNVNANKSIKKEEDIESGIEMKELTSKAANSVAEITEKDKQAGKENPQVIENKSNKGDPKDAEDDGLSFEHV